MYTVQAFDGRKWFHKPEFPSRRKHETVSRSWLPILLHGNAAQWLSQAASTVFINPTNKRRRRRKKKKEEEESRRGKKKEEQQQPDINVSYLITIWVMVQLFIELQNPLEKRNLFFPRNLDHHEEYPGP